MSDIVKRWVEGEKKLLEIDVYKYDETTGITSSGSAAIGLAGKLVFAQIFDSEARNATPVLEKEVGSGITIVETTELSQLQIQIDPDDYTAFNTNTFDKQVYELRVEYRDNLEPPTEVKAIYPYVDRESKNMVRFMIELHPKRIN